MSHSVDLVLQAVRQLGFSADSATQVAVGFTNTVYRVGPYAVRVSRDADYEHLHEIESQYVPFARAAGVNTPDILAVDDSRSILPATFSIYPWVDGETLGSQTSALEEWRLVAREAGAEAAKLHAIDPPADAETAWWPELQETLDTLEEKEMVSKIELASLRAWASRLKLNAPEFTPVLTHNDLHPWNLMVKGDHLATILDWANGGVGDPALDFAGLPLELLPSMLAGYRQAGAQTPPFFESAILLRWLGRALEEQSEASLVQAYTRRWQRWPEGGLAEVWLILQESGPEWSIWSPE